MIARIAPYILLAGCIINAGCTQGSSQRDADDIEYIERGLNVSERARNEDTSSMDARRPPAMVRGEPISWSTLTPMLSEASGAVILEEVVLERLLESECAREGISITQQMLDEERELLRAAIAEASGSLTAVETDQLVERVRRERGVGPERFRSQLHRSAMLRALVQQEVSLTNDALRLGYQLRYGDSYRVRVIVVPTAREASEATRRLRQGEPFGEVAASMSTDASAQRGGIIDPINPADTSWPESLRTTVPTLTRGQISDPVSVQQGYAILLLEESVSPTSGSPTFEQAKPSLTQEVRRRQEQLLMGRLARRLLDNADVTVLDQSLGWATR